MKPGIRLLTRVFVPVALLTVSVSTTLPGQPQVKTTGTTGNAPGQPVDVLTQHNDNARTGANLNETHLNTSIVGSGRFGILFSLPVDGQIYAQPLYVSSLKFSNPKVPPTAFLGKVRNVVYVATMHNTVYAFDADNPSAPLWTRNLGKSVRYNFMPMCPATGMATKSACEKVDVPHNIQPEIGITSTPVIDRSSNTIYVVAKTTEDGGLGSPTFAYRLHALDLLTGSERPGSPTPISAKVPSTVDGPVIFDPKMHLQRPGLLLTLTTSSGRSLPNKRIYIAFGSHQDTPNFHGWVLAYDAETLQQTNAFSTTANGEVAGGGIWQAGNGLAADESGNIYLMTGNGSFSKDFGGPDLGNSFVKLSPDLTVIDWFTPYNFQDMIDNDIDLGAAGPLLLPGTTRLVGGGKYGIFYLVDRNNMGHLQTRAEVNGKIIPGRPPLQEFQASAPAGFFNPSGADFHHIHGSPVTWNSPRDGPLVYVWPERDNLYAYRFDTKLMQFEPALGLPGVPPSVLTSFSLVSPAYKSTMKDPDSADPFSKKMPGGFLSISANGSQAGSGILWASLPWFDDALAKLTPGILRAFDAENVGKALWCGGVGTFAKFNPPTIANGKVYVATFNNRLNVYGDGAHRGFGGNNPNLGGYKTKSRPFVSKGYVYFQAGGIANNKLMKVSIDNPNGDN